MTILVVVVRYDVCVCGTICGCLGVLFRTLYFLLPCLVRTNVCVCVRLCLFMNVCMCVCVRALPS